ncbi:LacI family DNA-binding transcriptional regulator [Lacticaseibacillus kribbianus]|uniref:LacI family DNA-binding transcriptional regulator n=1 Tax=Lacticaseibacillus kribbianus TaxID=2926292 RepID=UPI001CD66C75|nr:LacI family DNA-binding transcriptional regulator [Lacticaseibacillus kribbianus]
MPKNLTIKEIAALADVSVSTVSRVINHKPSVRPDKERRVRQVIKENGFQPSMVARSMVSKKTNTLAVIVPDITSPYFTALIAQIELNSKEAGYTLLLFNTMTAGRTQSAGAASEEVGVFTLVQEKKVDGVIILGGEIDREVPDPRYLAGLNTLSERIPTVIVGHPVADCKALFIERNEKLATQVVTAHLLATGYRRIGFVGGEPGIKITTMRLNAFESAMTLYADYDPEAVFLSDYYIQDGYESMQRLLQSDRPVEAVVAINDRVALGAIRAAKDAGKDVPQDIAVASCELFPDGEWDIPRLTTVDYHNDILGRAAVLTLIKMIDGETPEAPVIADPQLVIRESCGNLLKRQARAAKNE